MKVLTIRQPWAWLIVHGHKRVENRTWHTSYRGPLLIHAAVRRNRREHEAAQRLAYDVLGILIPPMGQLNYGGLVGEVRLNAIVPIAEWSEDDAFACGPYCWCLEDACEMPFQPVRGRLGLWNMELAG